jgi:hypothetical protein
MINSEQDLVDYLISLLKCTSPGGQVIVNCPWSSARRSKVVRIVKCSSEYLGQDVVLKNFR